MELLIQLSAVILSLLLATIKSLQYKPNSLSEFELNRQVHSGSDAAAAEQARRELLPTYAALQSFKEIVISIGIAILLIGTHGSTIGTLLTALYFFVAYTMAARGWLSGMVAKFQYASERHYQKYVAKLVKVFAWLAPKSGSGGVGGLASRDELRQLIATDAHLLAPDDKSRMLGAFDFGSLIVADAMVSADDIKTVDIKETVGPVLLDRLHKEKHNIYVVVKKDINHIKGLLYMADLTPLDPEIKDVSDALRLKVHYLPVNAPLQDVLAASLVSGRQLFIAVDEHGGTKGLITLADTLKFLLGEPLPKTAPVTTQPHDNQALRSTLHLL